MANKDRMTAKEFWETIEKVGLITKKVSGYEGLINQLIIFCYNEAELMELQEMNKDYVDLYRGYGDRLFDSLKARGYFDNLEAQNR